MNIDDLSQSLLPLCLFSCCLHFDSPMIASDRAPVGTSYEIRRVPDALFPYPFSDLTSGEGTRTQRSPGTGGHGLDHLCLPGAAGAGGRSNLVRDR